jgi:hypothetical protein
MSILSAILCDVVSYDVVVAYSRSMLRLAKKARTRRDPTFACSRDGALSLSPSTSCVCSAELINVYLLYDIARTPKQWTVS